MRKFVCYDCEHKWEEPRGTGRPEKCPKCGSANIHRAPEDRGRGRGDRGKSQGRGGQGRS